MAFAIDNRYSTTRYAIESQPAVHNQKDDAFESMLFWPQHDHVKTGGMRTKGYFKQNQPGLPLVTIITVVLNGEDYLEETMLSVFSQGYTNIEYIIIDGGSTDSTHNIINKYDDYVDYWIIEEDAGIYEAMNKGIHLAQGEIIGIINASDYYAPDAVAKVTQTYLEAPSRQVIICGAMSKIRQTTNETYDIVRTQEDIKDRYKMMVLNHPATFVCREVYKKIGTYYPRYPVSADYDFFLRSVDKRIEIIFLKEILSYMREGGVSERTAWQALKDAYVVVGQHASFSQTIYYVSLRAVKLLIRHFIPIKLYDKYLRYRHIGKGRT